MVIPRRVTILVAAVALLSLGASCAGQDDAAAIEAVFSSYKEAVLAGEGDTAAEALSTATYEYYRQMRDHALYASEAEVKALSVIDMVQTLMLRARIPAEELAVLSGRELVALAIDRGWVGKDSVARVELGELTVTGKYASGPMVSGERELPQSFTFVKEDGAWRFDLTALLETTGTMFDAMAEGQGGSAADFVVTVLEMMTGEPVDPSIWQPPFERP